MRILALLIVAGICGAIGKSLVGYDRGGCLASIALGFIGAFLGVWVADQFGLPKMFTIHVGGNAFPVLWSIAGSAIFVAFLSLLLRRRDG